MVRSREIESYKQRLKLTPTQRETLVGVLLGDATLESQNKGRTYRVKIEQSVEHADYVQHLYRVFEPFVRRPPFRKTRSTPGRAQTKSMAFNTLSHSCFRFYAQQFYQDGKKVVPKLIHRWLTPRALAYWFMDDGSVKSSQSHAVLFNTQCFSVLEVQRLARVLVDRFDLQAKSRRQREGLQIYISGHSILRFREWLRPYVIPSMSYKLPEVRRTSLPKE